MDNFEGNRLDIFLGMNAGGKIRREVHAPVSISTTEIKALITLYYQAIPCTPSELTPHIFARIKELRAMLECFNCGADMIGDA